jgi:DNA-binding beta-propeller fold protein YncE
VSPTDGTVFTTGVTAGQIDHVDDMNTAGATAAYDPETGDVLWTAATENDLGYAVPEDLAVAPDGSLVFVAGWEWRGGAQNNQLLQALDASTGALVWEAVYDGPARARDYLRAVTVSGSRVIVTGESQAGNGYDVVTMAYDGATGARLWQARFDGAAHLDDRARALTTSPDGSLVLVTGQRYIGLAPSGAPISDHITVAYKTTTGEEVWSAGLQGPIPLFDGPRAMIASDDAVFVAGMITDHSNNGLEWATVAYDLETGHQLWWSKYWVGFGGLSVPRGIAVTPDGARVFVTGLSDDGLIDGYGAQGRDYATVGYDAATGSELWVAHYDGPAGARDQAHAVAVTPDGASVIVTGHSDAGPSDTQPNGPSWDFVTIAYDTTSGNQQWLARYNGSLSQRDIAYDLALSPSGDAVYVAGSGLGPARGEYGGEVHFQTVAYDLAP